MFQAKITRARIEKNSPVYHNFAPQITAEQMGKLIWFESAENIQ